MRKREAGGKTASRSQIHNHWVSSDSGAGAERCTTLLNFNLFFLQLLSSQFIFTSLWLLTIQTVICVYTLDNIRHTLVLKSCLCEAPPTQNACTLRVTSDLAEVNEKTRFTRLWILSISFISPRDVDWMAVIVCTDLSSHQFSNLASSRTAGCFW